MTTSKRALVTGLPGFTGKYLGTRLAELGYTVYGIGDGNHAQAGDRYIQADLTDITSLESAVRKIKPHVVVHLAAISFVAHQDPNAFYKVNVGGTRNLLQSLAALETPPDAVLLASSANIYGNATGGMLDEQSPPDPANDYAVSKLAMEYMARLWMDKLPIVITRPFNYTGRNQPENFLIPKIVSHFRQRADVIELGNIDVWRDFSDVRAVVDAYCRLLEVDSAGTTVNVCSGTMHSIRGIIGLLEAMTGHSIRIEVNPAFVREHEVKSLCGNPERLRSLIGEWESPTLEETLQWMLQDEPGL